jgi:hypothetical protein
MGRHKEVPETRRLRFLLQLLNDRDHLPPLALGLLLLVDRHCRNDVRIHERGDFVGPVALALGVCEIHEALPGAPTSTRIGYGCNLL